jgi:hypothetical protein
MWIRTCSYPKVILIINVFWTEDKNICMLRNVKNCSLSHTCRPLPRTVHFWASAVKYTSTSKKGVLIQNLNLSIHSKNFVQKSDCSGFHKFYWHFVFFSVCVMMSEHVPSDLKPGRKSGLTHKSVKSGVENKGNPTMICACMTALCS